MTQSRALAAASLFAFNLCVVLAGAGSAMDHSDYCANRGHLSRHRSSLHRPAQESRARVSGNADRSETRRARQGAGLRCDNRRWWHGRRRGHEERLRTNGDAPHRTGRSAGRGENRPALREHGQSEERERTAGARDACVRSRPSHGRMGRHGTIDGRAIETAGRVPSSWWASQQRRAGRALPPC